MTDGLASRPTRVALSSHRMGTRDQYATVAAVMQAFAEQNTWTQADLARRVGVGVPAVRKVLKQLQTDGMPLDDETERPHVYWSVEKGWFPGGVIFDGKDWDVLVHAVLRLPPGPKREALLGRLLRGRIVGGPGKLDIARLERAVSAIPVLPEEHEIHLLVERALLEGRPLQVRYSSANTGQTGWRILSPQRIFADEPHRVVAFCHTHGELRWFRLDNFLRARLELDEPHVDVPVEQVDAFVHKSVDGFHDGSGAPLAFRVRDPSAAWVRRNLLPGMSAEDSEGGIRVTAHGAALVVARFIVGLGGDAVAEGEELRAFVRRLASEAAMAHQ